MLEVGGRKEPCQLVSQSLNQWGSKGNATNQKKWRRFGKKRKNERAAKGKRERVCECSVCVR